VSAFVTTSVFLNPCRSRFVSNLRHVAVMPSAYTPEPGRQRSPAHTGGSVVQSAQPRDFAALALVVGLFVVLLVVTLIVGPSAAR
jgi:hypothetical protein